MIWKPSNPADQRSEGRRIGAQPIAVPGLIRASNGEEHREVRREVSPLFFPRAIREYLPQMVDVVRQELDTWPTGEVTDVCPRISQISLFVSAQNLLAGVASEKTIPLAEMNAGLLKKSYDLGVWMMPLNLPGTPYRRLLKYAEDLERRLLEIIDAHEPQDDDSSHLLDRLIAYHRASGNFEARGLGWAIVYLVYA